MPRKSLVLFLVVVVAGAMGVSRAFSQEPNEKEYQTLKKIIERVQEDYVTEVDTKKLFGGRLSRRAGGAQRPLHAVLQPARGQAGSRPRRKENSAGWASRFR